MSKTADLIFAGGVDLWKMYAEVHRLTLLYCRKKKKESKSFLNVFLYFH